MTSCDELNVSVAIKGYSTIDELTVDDYKWFRLYGKLKNAYACIYTFARTKLGLFRARQSKARAQKMSSFHL